MEELRGRRLLFVQEYTKNGFNGRQAYKAIYGNQEDSVADANASRLLNSVKVKSYLKDKMKPIENKIISQVETYSELVDSALAELKARSDENMPIREVISLLEKMAKPMRTTGELRGDIGSGTQAAVQINFVGGKSDLSRLGVFQLTELQGQIDEILKEKMRDPIMQDLKTVIVKPVEAIESQTN